MSTPIHDAATLKQWIIGLDKAIASGARSVTIGGQTVIYNTTDSLLKARSSFLEQLAQLERVNKTSRQSYAYYAGRGY